LRLPPASLLSPLQGMCSTEARYFAGRTRAGRAQESSPGQGQRRPGLIGTCYSPGRATEKTCLHQFLSRNSLTLRPGLGLRPGRGLGRGHAQIKRDLVNGMSGKFTSDKTVHVHVEVQVQVQAAHSVFRCSLRVLRQKPAKEPRRGSTAPAQGASPGYKETKSERALQGMRVKLIA